MPAAGTGPFRITKVVPRQEAGRVAAAVRAGREVLSAPVQVEQLVDERGADAEEFCHLTDGAAAAQGRR